MDAVTVTLNPCIDKTFAVDRVVPDRKLACRDVREYPGGGGLNVARVLLRLHVECRALWSGGGATGQRLAELLDGEDITHTAIELVDPVRENLIAWDASIEEHYRFGMPGPSLREDERARWVEHMAALPPSTRYAVVSGSVPGDAPMDWYGELLDAIPDRVRIVVDTKQAALRQALKNGVFLVKPNVHELGEIAGSELGDDAAVERAARDLIAGGGAEVVVVSLGRGGAMLVTTEGAERFESPQVPLKSKVGAGDSMVGGLVAGLVRELSLQDATALGVSAGAAAVMTEGTELCHRRDVDRLFECLKKRHSRS